MKSFFKKLAFVMALAMVVTLAAPAAQSALAATDFTYAYQNGGAVSELYMKAGDEVDVKFIGVKDYADYTLEWSSVDKTVATVDKNGVIKAVANGTTYVSLKVGDGADYTSAPIKVVVGEKANVVLGTSKFNTYAEYTLKLDQTVDFNFYGVPSYSANVHQCEWASSNTNVATVDGKGVVTPVATGTTTISVVIVNSLTGEILEAKTVVTVAKEATDGIEAYQASHITFKVEFEEAVSYGRDDVNLYRVFETDKGDVYTVWAVRKAALSEDGKTLTVEPYVQFGEGDRYLVAFADIENQLKEGTDELDVPYAEFETHFGEVTNVELAWTSKIGTTSMDDKIYTNGEDAEDDVEVILSCQLFADTNKNGQLVNLTEYYKNDGYVEYTLLNEDDVADYIVLSDDTLVFTKDNIPAVVQATYVFEDEEGDEKKIESNIETLVAEKLPAFSISRVKEWTLITDYSKPINWDKPNHSIRAGKNADIALLVVDNRGNEWEVLPDGFTKGSNDIADFGTDNSETEDMTMKFYSTDTDHFLVDEAGYLETYKQMKKAVVYVALHDEALLNEYEDDFVRNIGAMVIEIKEAAKFNGVAILDGDDTVNSVTLVTNAVTDPANTDNFVIQLTQAGYTVVALDQDGEIYDYIHDPVLENTIEFSMSTTNKDLREIIGDDKDGIAGVLGLTGDQLDVDAVVLDEYTKSSTITVSITGTQYDIDNKKLAEKRTSFKVYLRDPELFGEGESQGVWAEGDVKPTSWGIELGSNKGLMPTNGKSTVAIKIPMLSKSYIVGYYNRYDMSSITAAGTDINVAPSTDAYTFKKGMEVKSDSYVQGTGIYVLVTGPDGKAVQTAASANALGVYVSDDKDVYSIGLNVAGDGNGDDKMDYLDAGKYTVKITFVDKFETEPTADGKGVKIKDIEYKTRTQNFTVEDNRVPVKFKDMKEVTTSLKADDTKDSSGQYTDIATIKQIVCENYVFTYDYDRDGDNDDYTPSVDELYKVDCIVNNGYITVKSITFKIQSGTDGLYYYTTTKIERSVKMGVDEE